MVALTKLTKSGNKVHFEIKSTDKITEEVAVAAQWEAGYAPPGHGFYGFKVTRDPVLLNYVATWSCSASCD